MKEQTYYVNGMHCASCESLVSRKVKKIKGVESVHFSGKKIKIESAHQIPFVDLQHSVIGTDYTFSTKLKLPYKDIMWGVAIVIVAYYIIHIFKFDSFLRLDIITLSTALVMGLLASFSSCMATSGGLLLGMTSRLSKHNAKYFQVMFHSGRIIGYALFGALLGYIGSWFSISSTATGVFSLFVSVFMIIIGFQLIGIVPPFFSANTKLFEKINTNSLFSPALIGGATFFLPCGFTQALQLYALASGNPLQSGLLLFVFSLGTLPALALIGSVSQIVKGMWRRRLSTVAAVIVIVIGFSMLIPSLTLAGVQLPSKTVVDTDFVPLVDGFQIVEMKVEGLDYYPHQFVLRKDVPVKWIIDGSGALGCARILTAPKLGITERLMSTGNIVEFTPASVGEIPFHCSMAMTTPGAKFIVREA